MKKLFVSCAVVSLVAFSACKKKEQPAEPAPVQEVTVVEQINDTMAVSSEPSMGVPDFANPEVTAFANDYKNFVIKTIETYKSGDQAAIAALSKEAAVWAEKSGEIKNMLAGDDIAKFEEFVKATAAEMQKQMQQATTGQ